MFSMNQPTKLNVSLLRQKGIDMASILISGNGTPIVEKVSRFARCSNCEYLHENGNCLKVGGFYSSVKDKDCPKLNK